MVCQYGVFLLPDHGQLENCSDFGGAPKKPSSRKRGTSFPRPLPQLGTLMGSPVIGCREPAHPRQEPLLARYPAFPRPSACRSARGNSEAYRLAYVPPHLFHHSDDKRRVGSYVPILNITSASPTGTKPQAPRTLGCAILGVLWARRVRFIGNFLSPNRNRLERCSSSSRCAVLEAVPM
jgi:hypothetical protein